MSDIDKRLEEIEKVLNKTTLTDNNIIWLWNVHGEWLISTLKKMQKQKDRLQREINIYHVTQGDIEYAMDKVGWNNSRIEEAFEGFKTEMKKLEDEYSEKRSF